MHSYSVAFCPVFVLWHFVRVWFVAFCPVAFCPGFVITLPYIKTLLCIKTLLHIKSLLYIKTEIKFNTLLNTLPILIVQTNVIVILNMYALKVYNVHIDSVYCVHCTLYRKSALFRHFLAVFSLYRELCDLHKVDWAWTIGLALKTSGHPDQVALSGCHGNQVSFKIAICKKFPISP